MGDRLASDSMGELAESCADSARPNSCSGSEGSSSSTISIIEALDSSRDTTPSPSVTIESGHLEQGEAERAREMQGERVGAASASGLQVCETGAGQQRHSLLGGRALSIQERAGSPSEGQSEQQQQQQQQLQQVVYLHRHSFQSPHLLRRRPSQRQQQSPAATSPQPARQLSGRRAAARSSSSSLQLTSERWPPASGQAPHPSNEEQPRQAPKHQQRQHSCQSFSARRLTGAHSLRLQLVATSWLASRALPPARTRPSSWAMCSVSRPKLAKATRLVQLTNRPTNSRPPPAWTLTKT